MYKTFGVSDFTDFEDLLEDLILENEDYELPAREIAEKYSEAIACHRYRLKPCTVELMQDADDPVDPDAYLVMLDGVPAGHVRREDRAELLRLLKREGAELDAFILGGPEKRVTSDAYGPIVEETDRKPFDLLLSVRAPEADAPIVQPLAVPPAKKTEAPGEPPKLGAWLLRLLLLGLVAAVALVWLDPARTPIYAVGVAVCAVAAWIANNKV